ncbi:hypothetical protein GCM10022276_00070 [Sphingomonas limnosediminicola]|uniref:Uncharacterized protein n=1 Tax=Sphingomonas limnosediminicola TaxID=940133 RepID=A0ABP7KTB0_9SPHN
MWSAHDVAHHHHRRYSKLRLAELFERTGYAVELNSYFNSVLFPLIAASRLIGKLRRQDSADDAMPSELLNTMLEAVFGLEAGLIGRIPMPFGVSLVAVARRPTT